MSQFTVTRQKRWEDGLKVVEVNQGSLDYANSDMLVPAYVGEGESHVGLVAALEVAIEIAEDWQKQTKDTIHIGVGNTHGMSIPFDEMELTEETYALLRKKAAEHDEQLPKCCRCGDILGKDTYTLTDWEDEKFCSENCAERSYEEMMKEEEEEEEE